MQGFSSRGLGQMLRRGTVSWLSSGKVVFSEFGKTSWTGNFLTSSGEPGMVLDMAEAWGCASWWCGNQATAPMGSFPAPKLQTGFLLTDELNCSAEPCEQP